MSHTAQARTKSNRSYNFNTNGLDKNKDRKPPKSLNDLIPGILEYFNGMKLIDYNQVDSPPIPPGNYIAKFDECKIVKKKRIFGIKLSFKIIESEYAGHKVHHFFRIPVNGKYPTEQDLYRASITKSYIVHQLRSSDALEIEHHRKER